MDKFKCENCGENIEYLMINMFNCFGSDEYKKANFSFDEDVLLIETNSNWTGYELEEGERLETIECPCCNKSPFEKDTHIECDDVVIIGIYK